MSGALWYLLTRTFWNAIVFRLKRLRQPKYLIGAVLGILYFYFYFYRFLFRGDLHLSEPRPAARPLDLGIDPELAVNLGALGLLVITVVFAWIMPASRAALSFTEAELAFLLPGPISRRSLLRFKLLKSQIGLLVLALLMTLLTGRFARGGGAWLHAGGWWMVFATLQLHRLGASFVLTRAMDRGLSTALRRLIMVGAIVAAMLLLVAWRQAAPVRPDFSTLFVDGNFGAYFAELVTTGPAPWLLAPFRLVVQPWFAAGWREFVFAAGPALLVMALHYAWVMRSEVAFEEASVELSQKRAALLAAHRRGDMRMRLAPRQKRTPIFQLRPIGWVPLAFIWKGWLRLGGRKLLRTGLFATAALLLAASVLEWLPNTRSFLGFFAMLGVIGTSVLIFAGPQLTAQAVRRELQAADLLKTFPIPGSQIVLGEILGPALAFAAAQCAALSLVFVTVAHLDELPRELISSMPLFVLGAMLMLPPLNLVLSLIPTGAMLLFPGWFKPEEMRGIEATGLGLILIVAQFLFLLLAMIPPALAFAGVAFFVDFLGSSTAAVIAGAIAAASTLAFEGWLGVLGLGAVLDRFDPTLE